VKRKYSVGEEKILRTSAMKRRAHAGKRDRFFMEDCRLYTKMEFMAIFGAYMNLFCNTTIYEVRVHC